MRHLCCASLRSAWGPWLRKSLKADDEWSWLWMRLWRKVIELDMNWIWIGMTFRDISWHVENFPLRFLNFSVLPCTTCFFWLIRTRPDRKSGSPHHVSNFAFCIVLLHWPKHLRFSWNMTDIELRKYQNSIPETICNSKIDSKKALYILCSAGF